MILDYEIKKNVQQALAEDIGEGDLTASLVPDEQYLSALIVCRETAVICGIAWFDACFRQIDSAIHIDWMVQDGDIVCAQQQLCQVRGNARTLLSAERSALNFLQLLSAVATRTKTFVDAIAGTDAVIVDTRKTIPGLRLAQKYAVKCGGGVNHRIGLYDGILIKENHIAAAGGIASVLTKTRQIAPSDVFVEIEVESLLELEKALSAGAKMVLLDNFSIDQLQDAVTMARKQAGARVILEASGNVTLKNVRQIAETGVDRISIGDLTKNITAVDLSMRFKEEQ